MCEFEARIRGNRGTDKSEFEARRGEFEARRSEFEARSGEFEACRCNNLHLHEGRKITININSLCCSISEVQWSEVFLMIANKLQAHQ